MKHLALFSMTLLSSLPTPEVAASNIDTNHKFAWSSNAGWVNFRTSHGGVTVYPDHLEGYAYAGNIGWIKLGSYSSGGKHTYANTADSNWGGQPRQRGQSVWLCLESASGLD